jgi:hypothetical protein
MAARDLAFRRTSRELGRRVLCAVVLKRGGCRFARSYILRFAYNGLQASLDALSLGTRRKFADGPPLTEIVEALNREPRGGHLHRPVEDVSHGDFTTG